VSSAPPAWSSLAIVVLAVLALHHGREFLIPLALASLLGFWLTPVVSRVERWGVGRIAAVVLVTLLVAAVIAGAGWTVASQVPAVEAQLPEYRQNLLGKVRDLRGVVGMLERAGRLGDELERELESPPREKPPDVVVERPAPLGGTATLLRPLLAPAATAAAVAILVIFLLVQREDLRDRLLALIGESDLTTATDAIDDASTRLSRYLLMQSAICATYGLLAALGLFAIGIPGAWLWGLASGMLRLIPYLGPWLGATLPIAVSIAAFPGWGHAAATVGLFVGLELASNNVFEPWLYGTSAGLSPFAVVLSTFFWTWLWGIPGLFMATPLTLCAVVAGRYVGSLSFLRILLSDEAPLQPAFRLYQRLLCLDVDEAHALLREAIEARGVAATSDRIVLPALLWLQHELDRGAVSEPKVAEMAGALRESLGRFAHRDTLPEAEPVRVVGGAGPAAELAQCWIVHLLAASGLPVVAARSDANAALEAVVALTPRALRDALAACSADVVVVLCCERGLEGIARAALHFGSVVYSSAQLVRRLHSLAGRASARRRPRRALGVPPSAAT